MTLIPPGLSDALWRIVPGPLRSKLRSTLAKRFLRFAPAAVCAVAATQITYIICLGPAGLTAGLSGFLGWLAGAAVSYVISRWAWERRGRPHPLKETLPFVAVSVGAGIILTLASKFGHHVALSMGLHGAARVIVADSFYFSANCLTFALRFLIFHYVLFADRGSAADVLAVVEGRQPPAPVLEGKEPGRPAARSLPGDPVGPPGVDVGPWGNGRSAHVNGGRAQANGGHQPVGRRGGTGRAVLPDPGGRR